jgi:regulator of replication initiation timing
MSESFIETVKDLRERIADLARENAALHRENAHLRSRADAAERARVASEESAMRAWRLSLPVPRIPA